MARSTRRSTSSVPPNSQSSSKRGRGKDDSESEFEGPPNYKEDDTEEEEESEDDDQEGKLPFCVEVVTPVSVLKCRDGTFVSRVRFEVESVQVHQPELEKGRKPEWSEEKVDGRKAFGEGKEQLWG
jgi:hypothetical protein